MGTQPVVSESYFKYDKSDYAQSLRTIYGEDGYKKYEAKMNSIMDKDSTVLENPIAKSKKAHIAQKEAEYKNALAAKRKAANIWGRYKAGYEANLSTAVRNNNGYSLDGNQKSEVLANSGNGAAKAYRNYTDALSAADEALSLYFDATHSGMSFMG